MRSKIAKDYKIIESNCERSLDLLLLNWNPEPYRDEIEGNQNLQLT